MQHVRGNLKSPQNGVSDTISFEFESDLVTQRLIGLDTNAGSLPNDKIKFYIHITRFLDTVQLLKGQNSRKHFVLFLWQKVLTTVAEKNRCRTASSSALYVLIWEQRLFSV